MTKKGRIICLVLLFFIFSQSIKTQIVNTQKYLIIQQNEQYISYLNEFVSEPIIEVNLADAAQAQILQPYQQFQTYQDQLPLLDYLASIDSGDSSKYIISVKQQYLSQSYLQILLIYQQFSIDFGCSCLKLVASIYQQLDIVKERAQSFYGSFYSKSQGFVSYTNVDNQSKSFRYQINSQGQIEINPLDNITLFKHIAIPGPQKYIYIIQADAGEYQLIKLDSQFKQVFLKSVFEQCQIEQFQVDTGKYLFKYCRSMSSSFIKVASLDFTDESLVFQVIKLNNLSNLKIDYMQAKRIGNNLIICLIANKDLTIFKFISNESIIQQPLQQQSIKQFKLQQFQMIEFISSKLMVLFSDNYLYLFDIDKQLAVYQKQVCEDRLSIKFTLNVGNKILLYIYNNINKYSITISAEINIPQIVIQTDSMTILPIELSIKTTSQTTYQLQIVPKIDEQNQIFFSQSQISLQKTIQNFSQIGQYIIPIEDYIQGSDVNLIATDYVDPNMISNYKVIKYLEVKNTDQIKLDQNCTCYQTDGYFSSIFLCSKDLPNIGQVYDLYGAKTSAILQSSQPQGRIQLLNCQTWIYYSINQIDNQGSFTLKINKNQSEFSIFIPFVHFSDGEQFQLNQIQVSCAESNFAFATDPAYRILFTFCGEKITQYIFRFQKSEYAQIISTTDLSAIFSKNPNLICIQGVLFIYNSQSIIAYNYINQGLIGEINVPTIIQGKEQQLTLFMNSFLITVIDDPLKTIAQYSYNNFKTKTPYFMRNLQIDSNHPVSNNGIIIPKRHSIQEYAYIQSTQKNTFYLYRINSKSWSNQLFTTLTFDPKKTVIAPNILYSINSESSIIVLNEVSVLYDINIGVDQFNQNLQFSSEILVSIANQQDSQFRTRIMKKQLEVIQNMSQLQSQEMNQLRITIIVNRDANTKYGIVDHGKFTIQKFIQRIGNKQKYEDTENYFCDTQIFNSCILGWESDQYSSVINRIIVYRDNENIDKIFSILYNQQATIRLLEEDINSFFRIIGNFKRCQILDDKASIEYFDEFYHFNLYVICYEKIYRYKIQYQISGEIIKNAQVSRPDIYNLNQSEIQISQFIRIISYQGLIYIYLHDSMQPYLLNFNDKNKEVSLLKQSNSFYSLMNIHVLNEYNTQILIYPSGLIQQIDRNSDDVRVYNIQDLLKQFSFIVQKDDYIYSIQQYQDTQFLIAFRNSFIYDITFSINASKQLEIIQAYQYYYQDAFSYFILGFKGNQYTVFIGYNQYKTQQIVTLYSSQVQQSNIYLIQSAETLDIKNYFNFPQYISEQNNFNFDIQYCNSTEYLSLTISDNIFVKVQVFKDQISTQKVISSLQLKQQNNPNNLITFSYIQYGNKDQNSNTFANNSIFKIILLIFLFLCQFV
ncbi:transmembrane protein, putative (macronuclear) [Tetrahymena thermophila SB210]|uniref:Transmembrane protein, putative n=1 Tax=Tetrahymena thermophila (strain SB210) TaxID=312017 RepID=Q22PC1_TETTS|nr:transmembrane protein, putative [Tetrahymena thermophila SB210]EAR87188.2 transmembrane protein, putative [Tetrahymena thermophila SB210]|eukprot:XP_001007433.2 transmembrane protein, putative [Tetrahymena thermophila SB210]